MIELLTYLGILVMAAADGVVPMVPGEATVVAGAVVAATGRLSLPLVMISGALGAALGDSIAYRLGRAGQGRLKARIARTLGDGRILAAEELLERRGWLLILFGRFIPGIRILTSVSAGMLGFSYRRFLLFSLIGGSLWATYASLLGFFVGKALDSFWISLGVSVTASALISAALLALERRRLGTLLEAG